MQSLTKQLYKRLGWKTQEHSFYDRLFFYRSHLPSLVYRSFINEVYGWRFYSRIDFKGCPLPNVSALHPGLLIARSLLVYRFWEGVELLWVDMFFWWRDSLHFQNILSWVDRSSVTSPCSFNHKPMYATYLRRRSSSLNHFTLDQVVPLVGNPLPCWICEANFNWYPIIFTGAWIFGKA